MKPTHIAVIGGGAAGLTCAALLAEAGHEVNLYEANRPLQKVLASGNGRCNFTNETIAPRFYTGGTASFAESTLRAFGAQEAVLFFRRLGLLSKSLKSGMVYPYAMDAKTVAHTLQLWAEKAGVILHLDQMVQNVEKGFSLETEQGRKTSDIVVVATGGAYTAKGTFSPAYRLVKNLGHRITPLHPGIVALTTGEPDLCTKLAGLRRAVRLKICSEQNAESEFSYTGDILFAGGCLSGIAALKASNRCLERLQNGERCFVELDFYPEMAETELQSFFQNVRAAHPTWSLRQVVSASLHERLVDVVLRRATQDKQKDAWKQVTHFVKHFLLEITGSRKKDRGQVTCGGIATEQVNPQTLESLQVPGLYFAGEVLDVQGECGGYNLHWAWASAHAVANALR